MNEYPRETTELVWVNVVVRKTRTPVTSGIELAVAKLPDGRPTGWRAPDKVEDGAVGLMIDGLEPGHYEMYARVAAPPERPAMECGPFAIT